MAAADTTVDIASGNLGLSSLTSLCGLDFVPNTDLVLFLEDLNEPIYKIDKIDIVLDNESEEDF